MIEGTLERPIHTSTNPLSPELLEKVNAYWRAANYLSVGQIYLYDNPLLKKPLKLVARALRTEGIGISRWASNDQDTAEPDVVMACCGDTPTLDILSRRFDTSRKPARSEDPGDQCRGSEGSSNLRVSTRTIARIGLPLRCSPKTNTSSSVSMDIPGWPTACTYRRTNRNLHVRGYKEEGTITTAFDMRVQNDLDHFHLVEDVIDRVPNLGSKGAYLKQKMQDKLIQHKHYIDKHGEHLPEIRNGQMGSPGE